jgi:hypothetical protein
VGVGCIIPSSADYTTKEKDTALNKEKGTKLFAGHDRGGVQGA